MWSLNCVQQNKSPDSPSELRRRQMKNEDVITDEATSSDTDKDTQSTDGITAGSSTSASSVSSESPYRQQSHGKRNKVTTQPRNSRSRSLRMTEPKKLRSRRASRWRRGLTSSSRKRKSVFSRINYDDGDDETEEDPEVTLSENSSPETRRKSIRKTERRHLVKRRKPKAATASFESGSSTEEEDDDDVQVVGEVKESLVKDATGGEDCTEGSTVEVTYWKPSPEVKSVLDKVSITDVSCEDVTITVKECTTDDGFFKKKNKDDDDEVYDT